MKRLLLFIILLMLLAPAIQGFLKVFPEKSLEGFFSYVPAPEPKKINDSLWFRSIYQDNLTKSTESYIGFRSYLFVLHNQYDYSLFGITHAERFITGKKGMLFEEDYIREYTGEYFIGKDILKKKISRLKDVHDSLEKRGTKLLVIIEPGKASFYPEYIPDHYHPEKRTTTNYDVISAALPSSGIPFLDLNSYFLAMKDTSRYPLFPKLGMHWSIYGMTCMLDTFAGFIEKNTGRELPSYRNGKIEVTDSSRYTDDDIAKLLNLICPIYKQPVAYPEMIFDPPQPKDTLKVLVIGDSYYGGIEIFAVPHLFGKDTWWYYFSKVFPHTIESDNPVWVDKSNLSSSLISYDVILLMSSEINLHCFFWGFPDEAWLSFHPGYQEDPAYLEENKIRNDRIWFSFMVEKARKEGRSLEEMIRGDAEYMVRTRNK